MPKPEPDSEPNHGTRGSYVCFKLSKGTYSLATEYIKSLDKDTLGTKWNNLEEYLEYVCYELLAKRHTV